MIIPDNIKTALGEFRARLKEKGINRKKVTAERLLDLERKHVVDKVEIPLPTAYAMMVLEQIPEDLEDTLAVAAQSYLLLHQDEDLHDLSAEKWEELAIIQLRQFNAVDLVIYRVGILEMMQFVQKKKHWYDENFFKENKGDDRGGDWGSLILILRENTGHRFEEIWRGKNVINIMALTSIVMERHGNNQ